MKSEEIRRRFLAFFEKRGHSVIPSASLVPENDPTTLFTGSGMQPMVPYLLGEKHPLGTRIVNSQKSFRAGDIEEVGDNRHTTFFEMLGNWSLGDYFKREQLRWILEFLVDEIGIDLERIYITVFGGDSSNSLPRDEESPKILTEILKERGIEAKVVDLGSQKHASEIGMQGGRIFYYDSEKNWWSRAGVPENMPAGEPGGPDSEIFYEFKDVKHDISFGKYCHPNCDCGTFLEIGNSVFMEYVKQDNGSFSELPNKNVDFGGGLERIAMAAQNNPDIFEVNHNWILSEIEKASGLSYTKAPEVQKNFRVIADHVKAAVFLIADGVVPSNTDQGYILRRLIRRSVRFADFLVGMQNILGVIATSVIRHSMYTQEYPELLKAEKTILETINNEEQSFRKTLVRGLLEFEKGERDPFVLFTTYGFPLEMTQELAREQGESIDVEKFRDQMEIHQEQSRTSTVGKFKGGLADTSEATIKLHTAHHLLLAALQKVLGKEVKQRGSNITGERLRIDFSFERKLADEEKEKVENQVNNWIEQKLEVVRREMSREEAEKIGAEMEFGQKYPDTVSIYFIEDKNGNVISKEFCGGPHIKNTGELGRFTIQSEKASAAGVRRIKAALQ